MYSTPTFESHPPNPNNLIQHTVHDKFSEEFPKHEEKYKSPRPVMTPLEDDTIVSMVGQTLFDKGLTGLPGIDNGQAK